MTEVIIKKSKNPKKKYDAVIDDKKQFRLVLAVTAILPNIRTKKERKDI